MFDVTDLRSTIIPRSDQLNSEQLLGGPVVVTVTEVSGGNSKEQPVTVHYEGENGRPYKPCLTMRKLLVHAWGPDGTQWVGRSMELFNEPSIKFGPEVVGGIRISRLSHIQKSIHVALTASKGKKALHKIEPLKMSETLQEAMSAIAAATNNETLKKAKALASKLSAESDVAIAIAAYQKKVAELKAAASKPAEELKTESLLPTYIGMVDTATDSETATLILDEARDILTTEEHEKLAEHWKSKFGD